MNLRSFCLAFLIVPAFAPASAAEAPTQPPGQVLMLGVFHFANPGQDKVKTSTIDVMTPANQAYLAGLAQRLASFRPTDVLIECDAKDQPDYDKDFRDFRTGKFVPGANENYQIGFRVARAAGLDGVTCFNESVIGWDAQPMFDYLPTHEPALNAELEATFQSLTVQMNQEQATLSLPALLHLSNDPARDRLNKDLYLMTNAAGAGGNFVGADAAASWWHRNFRMYANVQKAAAPGHRVLVVAGQGHTAILKDLLAIDRRRTAVDVAGYLDDPLEVDGRSTPPKR